MWIHDAQIWTQDDAIAVKDAFGCPPAPGVSADPAGRWWMEAVPSEHMLFERINASGLGLTVGSIGDGVVRNLTFRDCVLTRTVKGIYVKLRASDDKTGAPASVSHVTFERVLIDRPRQWALWVGPAQQADARNPCHANPCSLCWPAIPGAPCDGTPTGRVEHLTLRQVTIRAPTGAPGVLLGAAAMPMRAITFEDVLVVPQCDDASIDDGGLPFRDTFGRLPATVGEDGYVRAFYALSAIAALGAPLGTWALLHAARPCWRRRSARTRATAAAVAAHAAAAIAAVCGAILIRLGALMPRLSDASAYYVCKGVEGSVATGTTWPVPPCFTDRTDARAAAAARDVCSTGLGRAAMLALVGAIMLLGALRLCLLGRSTRHGVWRDHRRLPFGEGEQLCRSGGST